MLNGKRVLGLIPARGGSKRLPKKNVLNLDGKPLIAWTIEAGQKSAVIDDVVVSTDDKEIHLVSERFGADRIIERPVKLATDDATSTDVLLHAIDNLSRQGEFYRYVAYLQPTSPLRTFLHIDDAFKFMEDKSAIAVIGVCKTESPIQWMGILPDTLEMNQFLINVNTQPSLHNQSTSYRINGAIYLLEVESVVRHGTLFPESGAYAYVMDREVSVDIDTKFEFDVVECLIKKRRRKVSGYD